MKWTSHVAAVYPLQTEIRIPYIPHLAFLSLNLMLVIQVIETSILFLCMCVLKLRTKTQTRKTDFIKLLNLSNITFLIFEKKIFLKKLNKVENTTYWWGPCCMSRSQRESDGNLIGYRDAPHLQTTILNLLKSLINLTTFRALVGIRIPYLFIFFLLIVEILSLME